MPSFSTTSIRSLEDPSSSVSLRNTMDYQSFSETTTVLPTTPITNGTTSDSDRRRGFEPNNSDIDRIDDSHDEASNSSNTTGTSTVNVLYRGFSTSINDMFVEQQYERIDCCAITCCGILQHDRDRFLLTGIKPPSLLKRFFVHFIIPFTIFFAAGIGALRIQDVVTNEIVSTSLLLFFLLYILLQCAKGRSKRIDIRKDLLFTKYQIQQQNISSANETAVSREQYQSLAVLLEHERPPDGRNTSERVYYIGQTRRDMGCAHPCFMVGCYGEDRQKINNAMRNNNQRDDSLCTCMFDYICPPYCGSYIQFCGMCAIAQEARDIETCILPAPYRRIDYITMEAVLKYYPAIYQQRHHGCSSTNDDDISTATNGLPHQRRDGTVMGHPLSLLSYRILQALVLFCFLMLLWSYGGSYYFSYIVGRHSHQQHQFEFLDCCLMILTFLQSFTLLGIWAFFINRTKSSELSFDAIIKYFASGFFLSASLALFWEMMSAAVINTFVSLLLAVLGIDRVENPQTDQTWQKPFGSATFFSSISNSPTLMSRLCWSNISGMNGEMSVKRPDYASVFGMDHPMLYTIYILIATFVVAGFIEELCKYFGYRMVEHPDFFSREELEEASIILENNHDEDMDEDDGSIHPSRSRPTVTNFSKQGQSVQARGAAITLAMVSVAIGFACCENLIYIFFYAGNSLLLELGVLIERSCFPVHPILAAIQSIGVCQRELEGSRSMKLGRIILPAVLFHGAFDFFIIFISFMGRLVGQGVEDGDLKISNTAEFLSVVSCVVIMFASSLYLYNESGKQRERLVAIDVQATIDRSSLI